MDAALLAALGPQAAKDALLALHQRLSVQLDDPRWEAVKSATRELRGLKTGSFDVSGASIRIGEADELDASQRGRLRSGLEALRPWKKGPFSLFGCEIDAEWRSDLKWDRLAPWVGRLDKQIVADIGCHNGYFMYKMLHHGAKRVVGFEPYAALAHIFHMLQSFHYRHELHFELMGVEHVDLFSGSFDTIFCLGILYHHTDPIALLRKMRLALKSKGRVFIDCQGIAGDEPLSLTPSGRYAGATGIWFLPTLTALRHWASRAGFSRVETIYSEPLSPCEQRTTEWAPIKSLRDFLDPEDSDRTIEGYPAPWRHYLLLRP